MAFFSQSEKGDPPMALTDRIPSSDLVGMKSGILTVVEFSHWRSHHTYWKCQCECGTMLAVSQCSLNRGKKSCGCLQKSRTFMVGQRIGRAVVVEREPDRCGNGGLAKCRCDCGVFFRLTIKSIREIAQQESLACLGCRVKHRGQATLKKISRSRNCTICGDSSHNRRDCAKKPKKYEGKFCSMCAGLSHRRKKRGCPRCGEPYAPEREHPMEYTLAVMTREDKTVYPRVDF